MRVIEIGGKSYELCFRIYSIAQWEQRTKKNISTMRLQQEYGDIMWLLWCALLAKQPKITVEKTSDIMEAYMEEGHDLPDLWEILSELLTDAGFMKGQLKRIAEKAETAEAAKAAEVLEETEQTAQDLQKIVTLPLSKAHTKQE